MSYTKFGYMGAEGGQRGARGAQGVGIESINFDENPDKTVMLFKMSDKSTQSVPFPSTFVISDQLYVHGVNHENKVLVKDNSNATIFNINTLTGYVESANLTLASATASRVPVFDSNKNIISSNVTSTELNSLSGITGNVQSRLFIAEYDISMLQSFFGLVQDYRVLVSTYGGVMISSNVTDTELNYISGLTTNVQTALSNLNAKFGTIDTNRVLVSNGTGQIVTLANVSATEVGYLNGVRSNIQTQIDALEGGGSGGDIPIDMSAGKVVIATTASTINTCEAIGWNADDEIIELSEKTHISGEDETEKLLVKDSDGNIVLNVDTTTNITHVDSLDVSGANSTSKFAVKRDDGKTILQADTTNNFVRIGQNDTLSGGGSHMVVGTQTLPVVSESEAEYVLAKVDALVVSKDPNTTTNNSLTYKTDDGWLRLINGALIIQGSDNDKKIRIHNNSGEIIFNVDALKNAVYGKGLSCFVYGSGADGDATLNDGAKLTRDMFYNNLTINGSVCANGYRVFVKNSLIVYGVLHNNGNDGEDYIGDDGIPDQGQGGAGANSGTVGGGGNGGSPNGEQSVSNALGGASSAGVTRPSQADGWIDGSFRGFECLPNMLSGRGLTGTLLMGGAGGKGGNGAGGGAGAGVLVVVAREILGNGKISCDGGNIGAGIFGSMDTSHGGAGGYLLVCTTYVQPTLTLSAKGGYGLDASGDYTFAEDGTVKLIYA